MSFFKQAWGRFAPATGIALFFVPWIVQASTSTQGRGCECGDYNPIPTPF
jgi:hypothetical protein